MRRNVQPIESDLRMESLPVSRFSGKRIHFIGIGGSGMSGLARMLLDAGAIVTGSEVNPNAQTFDLVKRGAKVSRDQIGELLTSEIDLVVRTAAVADTNPEFIAAQRYGIQSLKYAEMLGQVMAERFGIAVAGTHGKSTTTAMIAWALFKCEADPSFVVGGTVPQLGGGSRSGKSDVFVAEACEYDRSFHNLHPRVAIITNIEEDHLDCYKNLDDIIASFRHFVSIVPPEGKIITLGNDRNVAWAVSGAKMPIELVGIGEGFTWSITPGEIVNGSHTGEIKYNGEVACTIKPGIPGRHNLMNATMAVAACHAYGIDAQKAADAIAEFRGVDRRMMEVGEFNGAKVVDDYGHHPTEIRATLGALRERYQPKRLFCVFQPHQHSRTRFLLEDFAKSFTAADETLVPDIYFVRDSESEKQRVSSRDLVQRITECGQHAQHLPQFDAILEYLRANLKGGDLVVTMGAGNVWEIGRDLVNGK